MQCSPANYGCRAVRDRGFGRSQCGGEARFAGCTLGGLTGHCGGSEHGRAEE
ncbi:hypothetical protein TRAPUB_11668 [Trametes pubescens]|uniref:Uncharacterized protein n=1 Tax=Trametes pubescens TaxID=154538 RepID=A0A1M2VW33_TRAPU|nr:hypothetical protein TRAPUB_11668 [Trametes pubescens]